MVRTQRLGVGAVCAVKTKYMHPAKLVSEKYPNATAQSEVLELLVIKKESKIVNRREQVCVVF